VLVAMDAALLKMSKSEDKVLPCLVQPWLDQDWEDAGVCCCRGCCFKMRSSECCVVHECALAE